MAWEEMQKSTTWQKPDLIGDGHQAEIYMEYISMRGADIRAGAEREAEDGKNDIH